MNFSDLKYQIFISSTYTDLIKVREKIIASILTLYQIPIGMEMFSAGNAEQWTVISKTIQNSDYYLLVVGHRYGSTTNDGISYTEKEFDYAKSIGVPIFAFVRHENVATLPEERDVEAEKQERLKAFRKKVTDNAMVNFWNDEGDLAAKVAMSLVKLIQENPRIGWVKADKAVSPDVIKELAVLSKENRELKQELERYKAIENERLPNFRLFANDSESLIIDFKKFGNRYMTQYIEPINLRYATDVTLVDFSGDTPISKTTSYTEKVKEFNQKIAEYSKDVEDYNLAFDRQNRIADNNVEVAFNIENIGLKKANELYVDITFPDEILLFEEIPAKEKIKWPDSIPSHPYEEPKLGAITSILSRLDFASNKIMPSYSFSPSNFVLKGNHLTLRLGTLLHTRQKCISHNIYLVPLRTGTFTADVKFMCEELPSPIITTFEISVIEKEKPTT